MERWLTIEEAVRAGHGTRQEWEGRLARGEARRRVEPFTGRTLVAVEEGLEAFQASFQAAVGPALSRLAALRAELRAACADLRGEAAIVRLPAAAPPTTARAAA